MVSSDVFASNEKKHDAMISVEISLPNSDVTFSKGSNGTHEIARTSGDDEKNPVTLGFSAVYKWLSLSGEYCVVKGSQMYDYTGDAGFGRFGIEILTQKYKGYYLESSDGGMATGTYGGYTKYDDFSVTYQRVNTYFFFFKDYSFDDVFVQRRRPSSLVWSPFMKLSPGRLVIDDVHPLIPSGSASYYDNRVRNMNHYEAYSCALSAGASVVIPLGLAYIAPLASLGGEFQRFSHNGNCGTMSGTRTDLAFDFRIIAAYDDGDFLFGGSFENDNQFAGDGDMNIQVMNIQVKFFSGVRF
jgi:hypothetical protein